MSLDLEECYNYCEELEQQLAAQRRDREAMKVAWMEETNDLRKRIAVLEEQIENVREIHGRKVVELMHENRELDQRIAALEADITTWEQENTVIINKLDALLERLEGWRDKWCEGLHIAALDELDTILEARDAV